MALSGFSGPASTADKPGWKIFDLKPFARHVGDKFTGAWDERAGYFKRFRGRYDANDPEALQAPLIQFNSPWTSSFRVDPDWPHQLVNREGEHLLILNKTAWAFFGCNDPVGYLERARSQGVNVIRVALEGRPYWTDLGIELWPWGGTRTKPDWSSFNETYWQSVEERVRLAGEKGIGLDVVLYMELHPEANDIATQRPILGTNPPPSRQICQHRDVGNRQ